MDGKCLISAVLMIATMGCNQSPQSNTTSGASKPTGTAVASQGNPSQAVFDFLEAVRTGNDKQAAAMLTPLARQKTAEFDLVVAPPGSATAKFKVGDFKYQSADNNSAWVESSWTDVSDDQGHTRTDDIVWALRLEAEGWRIGGMVVKVIADQPALILNFEDPEDMIRKQQLLRGESSPAADSRSTPQNQGQPSAQPQTADRLPTNPGTAR